MIKVQAPGFPGMYGGPELGCGQGKRWISVDLKRPEGTRILHELVARSDVVHHNMTKGVAERLGIDYATLQAIKHDIICCNSFMYGPEGPLSDLGGLDPLAQAAAGLEYEAGPVEAGNPPLWGRFGHGDTANALSSVVGVLLALYHRKQTGRGQPLWASLLHATALWSSGVYETSDGPSDFPRLDQQQTGLDALYRQYQAHGGWVQLAAVTPGALGRVVRRSSVEPTSPTTRASSTPDTRPRAPRRARWRARPDLRDADAAAVATTARHRRCAV